MEIEFSLEQLASEMVSASKAHKVNPQDLMWNQLQKYMAKTGARMTNAHMTRMKDMGGFNNLKTVLFGAKSPVKAVRTLKLSKALRKEAKEKAEATVIMDDIGQAISKNFANPIYKVPALPKKSDKKIDRHVHIAISDTHFGTDLDSATGVKKYGPVEESRSMAALALRTIEYKQQYRNNTKLFVNILGDIIQGKIHDVHSSAKISEQICRAIHALGGFLHIVASEFPEVQVNCATGNHDRIPYIHHDRAMSDKYDSYASVIYYALKAQFAGVKNVTFNIPKTPFVTYESFGYNYWCTHGDNQIKVPNPMGAIKIGELENEVNKINARTASPRYSVFVVGHIHTGMKISLKNGATLITNPPLIPTDQYALALNIDPDAPTGQQLWESVPGYACGDSRTLWVTDEDRQNQSLDKIIKPFSGL